MKLAILGGGGFRVPLVYGALLRQTRSPRIEHVSLHDLSPGRLSAMAAVLAQMSVGHDGAPKVSVSGDLDRVLDGADFVFSAVRVGGLAGRVADERVALDLGLLGQETTGPGGVSYGLRTVPVAVHIAERAAAICPDAWTVNFTNPAGMVTEAMQRVLGDRVIGICDSPVGLARRAARALGHELDEVAPEYAGINHLGWLRGLGRRRPDGSDILVDLLADTDLLGGIEEGRLFGAEWLQSLGAIPNEYLYYYYFTRDALRSITGDAQTRGEFLLDQQDGFYGAVEAEPARAWQLWREVREERDATYMRESRSQGESRDAADVAGGGYEQVALDLMGSIARNERCTLILNVRNGSAVPGLPPEAVVEVPCTVDARGARPMPTSPMSGDQLGLVQQVKAVEQLTVEAALNRSSSLAVKALALHPLVDSVATARVLLEGYRRRVPALDRVFER
jgi:6-phospho-beta-glucosidase